MRLGLSLAITRLGLNQGAPLGERVSFSGTTWLAPGGAAYVPTGIKFGTWGEYYSTDYALAAGYGADHIRALIRSNLGGPLAYEAGADAYDATNTTSYFLATHQTEFLGVIDGAAAANLWTIVAYDSDQGQGVGRNDVPATGWDFFDGSGDAAIAQEKFFKGWEWIALQCRGRPRILAYELLPEPLPYNSVAGDAKLLRARWSLLRTGLRGLGGEFGDDVASLCWAPSGAFSTAW